MTHSMERLPEWDAKALIPNEKTLHSRMEDIRKQTKKFQAHRKDIEHPTRSMIEQIMDENEWFARESTVLSSHAMLAFSRDTNDEKAKARESHIEQFLTEESNARLFFGLWWKELEEKKAKSLLPRNTEHAYALTEMRKYKRHMLSEKEEQLSNLKSVTGNGALVKLYDIITNAYTYEWKTGTKKHTLNEEELRSRIRSPKPEERERAYALLWGQYEKDEGTLGEIYRNISMDGWNEDISLRKYKSPLSIRNMANDLSDTTVETFLESCRENTGVFQSHFAWKANELGHPLAREHIYAPIHPTKERWGFQSGYKTVMKAYGKFSPRMREEAHKVMAQNRMDAPLRKGKRSGAFCAGVLPEETSYVLLNWTGTAESVSTLAHELGHAIHNHLSSHHSLFTQHAGLPLAETASTFGEMLLDEHLLEQNTNPALRKRILSKQLDDACAGIQRQAYFTLFEKKAFEMVKEGKTIPEISQTYMENLRQQFGKKMTIPPVARHEWLGIPHFFHVPFYTYAYAFGHLLVLNFYARYQKEGKDFVQDYERFLAYGGSKGPEAMLDEMGFDSRKKRSWDQGFRLLETKQKELAHME